MAHSFRGKTYAAEEDSDSGEVSIEFAHARHFTIIRFTLLASERHRSDDEPYIDGLIAAYHKDPGRFGHKRKVTKG